MTIKTFHFIMIPSDSFKSNQEVVFGLFYLACAQETTCVALTHVATILCVLYQTLL